MTADLFPIATKFKQKHPIPPRSSHDLPNKAKAGASMLELILEADPLPHNTDPAFHPLTGRRQIPLHLLRADYHLVPPIKPVGRMSPDVLLELIAFEKDRLFPVFVFYPISSAQEVIPREVRCVSFNPELVRQGQEALSMGMEALVWFMRARGSMDDRALHHPEDIFSLFADPRSGAFTNRHGGIGPWENVALTMFRNATPYFGIPWIGVTMIVYEGEGHDMKLWIQKRGAHTKCGGMLDTTAGGAVETQRSAWEGMSKEAEEEASLVDAIVRKYARFHSFEGCLNFYLDPNDNPKPLTHLMFHLKRPDPSCPDCDATEPKTHDDEVESFIVMTIPEICRGLSDRKFQPSAVPDLIYFLYQKGFITHESEPELD